MATGTHTHTPHMEPISLYLQAAAGTHRICCVWTRVINTVCVRERMGVRQRKRSSYAEQWSWKDTLIITFDASDVKKTQIRMESVDCPHRTLTSRP